MSRIPLSLVTSVLLAGAAAAGCGKSGSPTAAQPGDNGGEHLLVYATDRTVTGDYDVACYDVDAGGFRSVAHLNVPGPESEPCLSDDGNLIAFASPRAGGAGLSDIYVYDRLGQAFANTHHLNTPVDETCPRFCYDSVRLAFVRDSLGHTRIKLYEPVGDTLIALPGLDAPGAGSDDHPAPDLHGNRIAFQSNRSGAWHVYVWDRSVGGVLSIPDLVGDSSDVEPSLSADGRWLAFASNRSGGHGSYDPYLYDLTTRAFVHTANLGTSAEERHPSVDAEGDLLFFQSRPTAADKFDIFYYQVVDSTRGQTQNLASAGDDIQPYLRWR